MSFIAKLFMPKMPSLPPIQLPEVRDVPNYEDEARRAKAEEDERRRALGRKGRRSTILTSAKGLNELTEEEYEQKSLIG
jgi:hypothetical protein